LIHFLFLSQNADYTNHQIADLSEKLEQAESQVSNSVRRQSINNILYDHPVS